MIILPILTTSLINLLLTLSLKFKNVHFPNLPTVNIKKCIRDVVGIGCIIILHLSKLWKAKFFILCDVISIMRLQEKFEFDHSWEWKLVKKLENVPFELMGVKGEAKSSRLSPSLPGWAVYLSDSCNWDWHAMSGINSGRLDIQRHCI